MERQKTLGYRIHDLLEYRSYPRKNIGYLYAIQHGAKIIYETDDDNSPTSGKITFYQQETGDFFVYKTDSAMVNPYEHFGEKIKAVSLSQFKSKLKQHYLSLY